MAYHYSFQNYNKEKMARSHATNLSISLKKSVETLSYLKGKKVSTAINFLERVQDLKAAVPYKRYNQEMPHRRGVGIAAGGFPVNVAKDVLKVLKNAQKNATEQEITGDLYILAASARKGASRYHIGRYMGRKQKSTNLEIVVGIKQ